MKIKYLFEGLFKTPAQMRAAAAERDTLSDEEQIASATKEAIDSYLATEINRLIKKRNIALYHPYMFQHSWGWRAGYTEPAWSGWPDEIEAAELRVAKVSLNENVMSLTCATKFEWWEPYTNVDAILDISHYAQENRLEKIFLGNQSQFIKLLKVAAGLELQDEKVTGPARNCCEMIVSSTIKIEKTRLLEGYRDFTFSAYPKDPTMGNVNKGEFGKAKYKWSYKDVYDVFSTFMKYFDFCNSGKLYFLCSDIVNKTVEMTTEVDEIVREFLQLALPHLNQYLETDAIPMLNVVSTRADEMKGGGRNHHEALTYMSRLAKVRSVYEKYIDAVDINEMRIELVTPDSLFEINRKTGEFSIGDNFQDLVKKQFFNARIRFTVGGTTEILGLSSEINVAGPRGIEYTLTTDYGTNDLKGNHDLLKQQFRFGNIHLPPMSTDNIYLSEFLKVAKGHIFVMSSCWGQHSTELQEDTKLKNIIVQLKNEVQD